MLSSVVGELKSFDAPEEKKGILGLFKKTTEKVSAMRIKYDKVENNINKISELSEEEVKILIDNLMAVGWIEFYFDLPAPDDLPDWRVPNEFQDTCAMYVFTALEPNSPKKTPKDPSQWKFEKFSDHSVRWTYRVTNADYDEAVRQTEERWAEKDDEE